MNAIARGFFFKLKPLIAAAVMDLYSKGTFGKDAMQWAKCVVKYLHDNYAEQVSFEVYRYSCN